VVGVRPCIQISKYAEGRDEPGTDAHAITNAKVQDRESSERPMLNAFCRVAPSVRFNFLAIFEAAVFLRAKLFSSRTSPEVQARRFFAFLAIHPPFWEWQVAQIQQTGVDGHQEHKSPKPKALLIRQAG
jgi:hypothetical protein